jgi:adenylate cyclase
MQTVGNTPPHLIDETKLHVERILTDAYPDYIAFEDGSFAISKGSTRVIIMVRAFTGEDCIIECVAHVVSGATITPELMKFLLRKNAELHIGGFGLLFDDSIIFSHSITGATMDRGELISAIASCAIIADHYDDEIVQMAGGKRASDLVELELH